MDDLGMQAFIDGLKPRRAGTPVVAVLALNEGTETTDFLVSHGLLQRAAVADVRAVAPRRGMVSLYPALQIEIDMDLAEFDRVYPSGADYVIVPAMGGDKNPAVDHPALIGWLQRQHHLGARIIAICAGGLTVGRAGLLDGRRFVSHWHYLSRLLKSHPTAQYVADRRYLIDRDVATTTGITASMPAMLAMIEALGGPEKARSVAEEVGLHSWTPEHQSALFQMNVRRAIAYVLNKLAFWRRRQWCVEVYDGMDDIVLALTANAWSRTGWIDVVATSSERLVKLRSGIRLSTQPSIATDAQLPLTPSLKPVQQLNQTLGEIAERFGATRKEWVMLEMEYPDPEGRELHTR
jgi:putative intracellular protease/amidase